MTDFQKGVVFAWVSDLVWNGVIVNCWKVWREVQAERRVEELVPIRTARHDGPGEA